MLRDCRSGQSCPLGLIVRVDRVGDTDSRDDEADERRHRRCQYLGPVVASLVLSDRPEAAFAHTTESRMASGDVCCPIGQAARPQALLGMAFRSLGEARALATPSRPSRWSLSISLIHDEADRVKQR